MLVLDYEKARGLVLSALEGKVSTVTAARVILALKEAAIEATPVVHGRWETVHDGWGRCSNCHRMDEIHELATHCRFCGARMDGEPNG